MKIKNQFILFIIGSIIVPLLCLTIIPLYHYFTAPERILLQDFNGAKKIQYDALSENDWNTLREMIEKSPPHVETIVILNHNTILISNFSEFKSGQKIEEETITELIQNNKKRSFYQFVCPQLENDTTDVMIISRAPRKDAPNRKRIDIMLLYFFIILGITEIFISTFIIKISKTISRSISILEKNTQRIANGELDVVLNSTPNARDSNEITSLTESLNKMRQSLIDSQERRTRFIMGISHDLRTPVAVIKGYTEAISDGIADDPEMIKNALEIIGTKTNQLETMIDSLINYVKLNDTEFRATLKPQKIQPVLKEFAETSVMTGRVFKRKIFSTVKIDENLLIPFNKQLLIRALENIYSNAIRYSKDDDTITINAEETNDSVKISISDTGIGIPESERDHVFDMFYKGSNSRREEGMGIGLSVVKNIVDTHGWRIAADKNPGGGTIFTITIPKIDSKTTYHP